jgi:hypothetical protein
VFVLLDNIDVTTVSAAWDTAVRAYNDAPDTAAREAVASRLRSTVGAGGQERRGWPNGWTGPWRPAANRTYPYGLEKHDVLD